MPIDPRDIAYMPSTGVRRIHETPLLMASDETLVGYGCLVDDPRSFAIEIRCAVLRHRASSRAKRDRRDFRAGPP
jgi:hypothetical protein